MPRAPRIHYPGAVYHAMARGVDGRLIFCDDRDYSRFLETLRCVAADSGARIIAYCLMPNHFHSIVKVDGVPLSRLMQRILTRYAITFNLRHDRMGHLFQARYKAILCLDDAYLASLIRYIHNNPVRAHLVDRADAWKWTSFLEYHDTGKDGLIETSDDLPDFEEPNHGCHFHLPDPSTGPALVRTGSTARPSLETIGDAFASEVEIDILRSRSRRRQITSIRRRFVESAARHGHSLTAISDWLGITVNATKHYLQRNNCKPASLTPP